MTKKLEPFIGLVDFLADYLGEHTEVVLHDMTDWHCSVVAIRNGYISGRKVGAPITDLGLSMVKDESWRTVPYRVNYKGTSSTGGTIRSATYFIRDDGGSLIGMLCINMDCQSLVDARNVLDSLISIMPVSGSKAAQEPEETFNMDVKDLVASHLRRIVPGHAEDLKKMGRQEKVELVEKLQEMGTFMVKGTIWEVADILGVSVPTVYRYLSTIKKENE